MMARSPILLALVVASCTSSRVATPPETSSESPHETLNAVAWMQLSAEYRAVTTGAYRTARSRLAEALGDPTWTAIPGQDLTGSLPTAVIVDVDETILDNAAFQARLVVADASFSSDAWSHWVIEARAGAVPGSVDFARAADSAGVYVFYVTNRSANLEEATRTNLEALGFPVRDDVDVVLTRGERAIWTGDKTIRRSYVAAGYRVLLVVGDDLNDFVPAEGLPAADRHVLVDTYSDFWGQRWIMLPNPVYGSWERTVNRQADAGGREEQIRAKVEALDTGRGEPNQ